MENEVKIEPASIKGEKFRLAGIEIDDRRDPWESGGRLVRVFARFCGINDDPQDKAALHRVRVTSMDVLDMFPKLEKKRHFWQRKPEPVSADFKALAEDMHKSGQLLNLFRVITAEESSYRAEISRTKTLFRPVGELKP